MEPILVPGGTGRLGHFVVSQLHDAGCPVRVLSRHGHAGEEGIEFVTGDLATGEGIDAAVEGTRIIVFCAGSFKGDSEQIHNLIRAASHTGGTQHLVYISVVGADQIPLTSGLDRTMFAYFGSKLAGERAVAGSGLPWTTLRATQFYDAFLFILQQMAKLPVLPVPAGFRFQPIDTGEVAKTLVDLALGTPAGLASDVAGPRIYGMDELIRRYLRARRTFRPMVPVWIPGRAARAIRAGAILARDRAVGRRTWEDFLAAQLSSPDNGRTGGRSSREGVAIDATVHERRSRDPG
jgi:uncharacterized protein YbjT (DUF2867 family)